MKYLTILLFFLSGSVMASKDRCPIASPSNVIGRWQAYNPEKSALYELRFEKDGSSTLAASTLYGQAWFGVSKEITHSNSGLSLQFTNNNETMESVVVHGFGVSCEENGVLSLVMDSQEAGHIFYFQSIKFHKYIEENFPAKLARIQQKIDDAKTNTKANQ